MMAIYVRIDRIVLDDPGLTPRVAQQVREAIAGELAKLITTTPRSAWKQSRTVRAVRGTWLAPSHGDTGTLAARALHHVVREPQQPRSANRDG